MYRKLSILTILIMCISASWGFSASNLARDMRGVASTCKGNWFAIDGDGGTRWESGHQSDPQWFKIDLQTTKLINNVTFYWEGARASHYQVLVATVDADWGIFDPNDSNWTVIFSTDDHQALQEQLIFDDVEARYVVMYGTARIGSWGYSLYQFIVSSGAADFAKNMPAASSTTVIGGHHQMYAFDGNAAGESRWESMPDSDPQWIYVDLESTTTINTVVLKWEGAYASAYQVQVSTDANTWSDVYSTSSGDGGTDYVVFESTDARYVRVYGTTRVLGAGSGYSIYEFEVYLDSTPPQAITDLEAAQGQYDGWIDLDWTSPGDDGSTGDITGGEYEITLSSDTAFTYYYTLQISTSCSPFEYHNTTIKNLEPGVTYYMKIRTKDEANNWSALSEPSTAYATIGEGLPVANVSLTMPWEASSCSGNKEAFDKNGGSRWISISEKDPQWIYVDLNSTYTINTVTLEWETARAASYDICTSTNAVNWYITYSTGNHTATSDTITFRDTVARYVMMFGKTRVGNYGYSLYEFTVSTGGGSFIQDGMPSFSSSTVNIGYHQRYAFDGDPGTRWQSESWSPQWIYKDLGSEQWVNSVTLDWGTDYASSYQIQVSTDAENWSDVYTTTTGDGGIDNIGFSSASVRYVKMNGTAIGSGIRYIIDEFDIFLDTTPPSSVTDLAATQGQSGGQIRLDWTAPGDDGSSGNIVGGSYNIIYSSDTGFSPYSNINISTSCSPGEAHSKILTGLEGGVTYYIKIRTGDDAGLWSGLSEPATAWAMNDVVAPAVITDLAAETGSAEAQIRLDWTSPGDDGSSGNISGGSYEITYSSDTGFLYFATINISTSCSPGEAHNKILTGLEGGVTYYIKIRTEDDAGLWSGLSEPATAWAMTDAVSPAVINDLVADAGINEGEIRLDWTSPGDDGSSGGIVGGSYNIRYSSYPTFSSYVNVNISTSCSPGEAHNRILTGLDGGVTYYMKIRTSDESGNWSGLSEPATAWAKVDPIPPSVITDLVAVPGSIDGKIDLDWTSPGDDGTAEAIIDGEYEISYSSDSGFPYYGTVQISTSCVFGEYHNWTLQDLEPGVTFYIKIRTSDDAGNWSALSEPATAYATTGVPFERANVSLTLPWEASSVYGNKMAFDTDMGSRWESIAQSDPQWIYVDLQSTRTINTVILTWENAMASSYDICISSNASDWFIVYSTENHTINKDTITFSDTEARYVMMYGKTRINGDWGYSLFDFKVSTGGDTFVQNGMPSFSSSTVSGGYHQRYAFDGNGGTQWQSEAWSPQWIYKDLGSEQWVNSVTLDWGTDYASSYQIQVSTDAENWSGVYTTTTGDGNIDDIGFSSASVRYVKMNGTAIGSGIRYIIDEFDIFLDTTPPSAVTDLAATQGSSGGQIRLDWTAPGDDGSSGDIVGGSYEIIYSSDTGFLYSSAISVSTSCSPGEANSRILTGLGESVTYYIKIRTEDNAGLWSGLSEPATAWAMNDVVAPAVITDLAAETGSGEGQIRLDWTSPGDDGSSGEILGGSYNIRYSTYPTFSSYLNINLSTSCSPGEAHSHILTGLDGGVTFYFKIRTEDDMGLWSGLSEPATAWAMTDATPPAVITDLVAVTGSNEGEIRLDWTSPGDDGSSGDIVGGYYNIRYSSYPTFSSYVNVNVSTSCSPGEAHNRILAGLDGGVTYYMKIRTMDEAGNWSSLSEPATAWAMLDTIAPAVIDDLTATQGTFDGQIDLDWTSPGDNGSSGIITGGEYEIRYSSDSGFPYYGTVQISTTCSPGESHSRTLNGLEPGTTYFIKIRTSDESENWSDLSDSATAYATIGAPLQKASFSLDQSWKASTCYGNSLAFDIDGGTRWESEQSDPQWIYVDLQSTYTVNQVILRWETARAASFDICISTNASDWYIVYSTSNHTIFVDTITFSDVDARYVIMYGTARVGSFGYSLFDFEVYGTTNIAGKKPSASSSASGSHQKYAFDGNPTTLWESEIYDPQWIYRDLGSPTAINTAKIYWGSGYASNYQIQCSADALQWTDIYSTSLGSGNTEYLVLTSTETRYVRMYGTARGAGGKYSIYEFSVYLDTTPPAAITDLAATHGLGDGQIRLDWTAPGDDGNTGDIIEGSYEIRYSSDTVFSYYGTVLISTACSPGEMHNRLLTGLEPGTTYYIKMRTSDETQTWSQLSEPATTWATIDDIAPSVITDLTSTQGIRNGQIKLDWTSPGDDADTGNIAGGQYEIRYSSDAAFPYYGTVAISTTCSPGESHSYLLTLLDPGATYYVKIRTADEGENWSALSEPTTNWAMIGEVLTKAGFSTAQSWLASTCYGNYQAFDGNSGSRWISESSDPQWIYVDLQSEYSINQISLQWEAAMAETYDICISTNAEDWYIIFSTDSHAALSETLIFSPVTARYVMMYGYDRATEYSYSIFEFAVSGGAGNLALNKPSVSSSAMGSHQKYAFDGSLGTNWESQTSGTQWVYKDLGSTTTINNVKLHWHTGGYASSYQVQASTDADTWEDLYTTVSGSGGTEYIAFTSAIYRYVRMYATVHGTGGNYSIDEFEIFEDTTPPSAVTSIAATQGQQGGHIDLSWISPGDDSYTGFISSGSFEIRYSSDSAFPYYGSIAISTSCSPGEIHGKSVGSLEPGVTYYMKIRTRDDVGLWSGLSDSATAWAMTDSFAPSVVTNLSASPGSAEGQVFLTWTAPGDDGYTGTIIDGNYEIRYSSDSAFPYFSTVVISTTCSPGDHQTRVLTGLEGGTTFYVKIRVSDELNNWSDLSESATAWAMTDITPPAVIADLSGTQGANEGEIELSWTSPGDDGSTKAIIDGNYDIRYSSNSAFLYYGIVIISTSCSPGETHSRILTGLEGGTTYYIKIRTSDELGNYSGLSQSVTTWSLPDIIPPAVITTLSAVPGQGSGKIDLSWTSTGDDALIGPITGGKFEIRYSVNPSFSPYDYTEISTSCTSGEVHSWTIKYLDPGTTYYIKVRIQDESGNWSALSEPSTTYAKTADGFEQTTYPLSQSWLASTCDGNAQSFDGNTGSRWESEHSDPQWIYVDLQSNFTVNQIVLRWETAMAKEYELAVSTNAQNWYIVFSTNNHSSNLDSIAFPDITARYVIMYGYARTTSYGYSLFEFEVYGATNVAKGKPAISSSASGSHQKYAFDGNTGTRWASEWYDPQWIYRDFGSPVTFNSVTLQWDGAYGKSYIIQTSDDAESWTDVYTTSAATGGSEGFSFGQVTARYVRFYGTEMGTGTGYSLSEFDVFLDTIPPSAVNDLNSSVVSGYNSLLLTWTAPGNNGASGSIIAGSYEIRYSSSPTLATYDTVVVSTSCTPGDDQSYILTGLTRGTTYFVQMRTSDQAELWSELSNVTQTYLGKGVSFKKLASTTSQLPGQKITFTLRIENNENENITGAQIIDVVPYNTILTASSNDVTGGNIKQYWYNDKWNNEWSQEATKIKWIWDTIGSFTAEEAEYKVTIK
ncbi:MAG: discoidin domain-containing protein [Endomicrobiales bacterium]|nr:discoidin domain-containing protein [Endomicrobiales bacterium]